MLVWTYKNRKKNQSGSLWFLSIVLLSSRTCVSKLVFFAYFLIMWLNNEPIPRWIFGNVIKNWENRLLSFNLCYSQKKLTKSYNKRLDQTKASNTDYGLIGLRLHQVESKRRLWYSRAASPPLTSQSSQL